MLAWPVEAVATEIRPWALNWKVRVAPLESVSLVSWLPVKLAVILLPFRSMMDASDAEPATPAWGTAGLNVSTVPSVSRSTYSPSTMLSVAASASVPR